MRKMLVLTLMPGEAHAPALTAKSTKLETTWTAALRWRASMASQARAGQTTPVEPTSASRVVTAEVVESWSRAAVNSDALDAHCA